MFIQIRLATTRTKNKERRGRDGNHRRHSSRQKDFQRADTKLQEFLRTEEKYLNGREEETAK